jgi:hypothetical protein
MVMKSINGVTLCLNRLHRCIFIKGIDKMLGGSELAPT